MIGAAMGLAARGAIPFPSTFACFLTRAADFIRMAAISNVGIKMAGSHAGVSIGEDGPSADGARGSGDVPGRSRTSPCSTRATRVSAERLVALAAYHPGAVYIRTSRPKTPVIYGNDEPFVVGGLEGPAAERGRRRVTIVAAGVTVFEALKAHDELKAAGTAVRVIDLYSLQPVDRDGLIAAGQATGGRFITVEDHYAAGGIGDAVAEAVARRGLHGHAPRGPRDSPQRKAGRAARSLRHLVQPHRRRRARDCWQAFRPRIRGLKAASAYVIASAAGESGHTGCAAAT